jgi:methylated-DNA-[protein]-cysteine S-methyltransferase
VAGSYDLDLVRKGNWRITGMKFNLKYIDENTDLPKLILGSFNEKLCLADWRYRKMRSSIDKRIQDGLGASFEEGETQIIQCARQQLKEYLAGKRTIFDIPLLMVGTSFQKRVWNELLRIPFGETESYLSLSRRLGDEKAIRSVAAANGANAISIFIPCHRIIGSDGKLTGYGGGIQAKRKLLQLEMRGQPAGQLPLFN